VKHILQQLESFTLRCGGHSTLFTFIDGKPLPINGCSKNRQAGYGHAAGCKARGYILADAYYDSNPLHKLCGDKGNLQLVAPRRISEGLGHRRHDPG
jgi:hypothetical protein